MLYTLYILVVINTAFLSYHVGGYPTAFIEPARHLTDPNNANAPIYIIQVDRDKPCHDALDEFDSFYAGTGELSIMESLKSHMNCFIKYSSKTVMKDEIFEFFEWAISVEPDNELEAFKNYCWNLDRIDQLTLPLDKKPFTPLYNGSGVTVYVLDTGIRRSHTEFDDDRASFGASFISSEDGDADLHGHGTHVASTVAGKTVGVAPGARVVSIKVLGRSGQGSTSGVISGIQYVINATINQPAILSLSLGGSKSISLNRAISDAYNQGNIAVVAAGNSAADACHYSPSSEASAITVGATTVQDKRAGYSNYGECVDLWAPGSSIVGASYMGDRSYRLMSGTSMATPAVSGALAGLLQKFNHSRDEAILELLSYTSQNVISGTTNDQEAFLLNVPSSRGENRYPTPQPTGRPTFLPVVLCVTPTQCFDFEQSRFGDTLTSYDDVLRTKLVQPPSDDPEFCAPTGDEYEDARIKGNIVIIDRGSCLFYEKVMNAQNAGAIGVIHRIMEPSNEPFQTTYYGNDKVPSIPAVMVNYDAGILLTNGYLNREIFWGHGPVPADLNNRNMTETPTKSPTFESTPDVIFECSKFHNHRVNCRRNKYCSWKKKSKTCELKPKYDSYDG